MQALYGLEQAKWAQFQICVDKISHAFDPDWNDERSPELNAERVAKAKEAEKVFREHYQDVQWLDTTLPADVRRIVQQYITKYHVNIEAERKGYFNGLLRDAHKLYENYLLLLALPKALANLVHEDRELLRTTYLRKDEEKGDYKFRENKVVQFLSQCDELLVELKKRNLSWSTHEDVLKEFYRNTFRPDKTYKLYNESKFVTFEEEREMISHIYRHLVFSQQNLIYFSLKEFEVKRYGLQDMAREQGIEAVKLLIFQLASETLQKYAQSFQIPTETIQNWCEEIDKHLKDFAQNLAKVKERMKETKQMNNTEQAGKEKDRDRDKKEREQPQENHLEGKEIEQKFADSVRRLHATLREAVKVLVEKFSRCLEEAGLNLLDKQKANLDTIEEALHTYLEAFGVGKHPEDQITLQMENEKGASILQDLFQQIDYNWEENGKVVQNMLSKTVKMFDAPVPTQFELVQLSANWEDDKEFFLELFKCATDYMLEADIQLSAKTKNWDISRMVGIDRLIMQMAIAEMVNFSSIPVKATLNEYLEIAKIYSTPRSKEFINGLLDQISQSMQKEGLIRKSGRGLIDNK